jgi:hypothetical protein
VKNFRQTLGIYLLAFVVASAVQARAADVPVAALQGAWRQVDGERLCYVHGSEVFIFDEGRLSVYGVVHHRPGTLVLRSEGKLSVWHASLKDRVLEFGRDADVKTYRKLTSLPAQLVLKPFPLGEAKPLPAERVKLIQDEIARRWERDQEVRKDPAQKALALKVDADNREYFLNLLHEVGWLDAARFGTKTSVYATLFVKHIYSLALNLAALPYVERDLKATGEGQIYAILYDDTQLHLGRKQRYGTQLDQDAQGNPYVLPLEQPRKVDELLKAIGQPPLATYLADASRVLYDGKPIRLATPEESE